MSTDPNLLAALLQGDQDPGLSGLGDTAAGQFAGGVGKGLYNQYIDPAVRAGKYWWNYSRDPIAGAQGLMHDLAAPGDQAAFEQHAEALRPSNLMPAIAHQLSTPAGAGEALSYALPGPGQVLGDAERLGIWGGKTARTYNPELAAKARQMGEEGVSPMSIYRETQDPNTGGGFWNPPREWNPSGDPWMWINDEDASLRRGSIAQLNAEQQTQLERAGLAGMVPRSKKHLEAMGDAMSQAGGLPRYGTPFELGDILQHPRLYEAYPGIADTTLFAHPHGDRRLLGGYLDRTNQLFVGHGGDPKFTTAPTLSTLLHEPAHMVQYQEGWPTGGGPADPSNWYSRYNEVLLNEGGHYTPEELAFARDRMNEITHAGGADPTRQAGALQAYHHMTGEANARLPETVHRWQRQGLDEIFPWQHYDIGRDINLDELLNTGSRNPNPVDFRSARIRQLLPEGTQIPQIFQDIATTQPVRSRIDLARAPPEQLGLALAKARARRSEP